MNRFILSKRVPTKAAMMFSIKAENLHLTRNGVKILDELSVEFEGQNGITVVLGFNGAGKSALLKVLAGLVRPDSGKLTYGGIDVQEKDILEAQTLVLQKPVMLRRSVGENVKYGLRQSRNLIDRKRRLDALLEQCEVGDLADRPARSVSIGEQQRVSLARALALDPKLIYLDEPTSSLDPISVQIVEDVIKRESCYGRKIVLVTHSVAQARRLASDVIFIHCGCVVEHQKAAEFFRNPRTEVARSFIEGSVSPKQKEEVLND